MRFRARALAVRFRKPPARGTCRLAPSPLANCRGEALKAGALTEWTNAIEESYRGT